MGKSVKISKPCPLNIIFYTMKDIIRSRSVLKDEVIEAINKQIKMEATSASAYLAMAAWCEIRGYENSATFFFKQSDEERGHQLKLFHYLTDMEAEAISPATGDVEHEFPSLRSVFEKALQHEISVSESIHDLVRLTRKEGDIATEEFLRWFVQEQIEEEYVARRCLELFDVLGEDQIALGMFEERVLAIEYDNE